MKTKILNIALFALFFAGDLFAQDVTTVRANTSDISDNLDLRAVASIFGDSRDLEDFERRLNDPDIQISNLDLNGDGRVDYLRVIEANERNTHLIILQAVLGIDTYQDVATIEVERDGNDVQVQVVGDVYMYGTNYIYEPVYVRRPVIFDVFWVSNYRPYYSPWYWGYYPTYYTYWAPYPVYRYRNHVHGCINTRNNYNYVNTRRSSYAASMYSTRRSNAYERQHPDNSFNRRNANATNRYALEQNRESSRTSRAASTSRNSFTNSSSRTENSAVRNNGNVNTGTRNTSTRNSDNIDRSGNTNAAPVRSSRDVTSPARTSSTAIRQTRQQAEPQTSRQTETIRGGNTVPQRNTSAPAVRTSTPVQRSTPQVRQSAPAPQRQSAPAPSRSSSTGNAGGRNSRG